MPVAEASGMEQPHLLPLAEESFGIHETLYPLIVDGKGRVGGEWAVGEVFDEFVRWGVGEVYLQRKRCRDGAGLFRCTPSVGGAG
jgi:hypothetical protein